MKSIIFDVELLEPVLVTAIDGDPNSGVSYDFVPGTALRGAIIARYLQARNLSTLSPEDPGVRRLFFDGSTRFLNGYLRDGQQRTLPVPLSWQHHKGDDSTYYDLALEEPEADGQLSPADRGFCTVDTDSGEASLLQPERHVVIHVARDRVMGRPTEESGAIYRYDALAPGQCFRAAVLCDHAADAATLLPLLDGEVWLGKARSAGYGHCRLKVVAQKESWQEAGEVWPAAPALVITCLSDLVMRDEHGQFAPRPTAVTAALNEQLMADLGPPQSAFMKVRLVGGFNRTWGLPLWQAPAVQMGSVFVFAKPPTQAAQGLRGLLDRGIGERRAEGFGRLAVGWQQREELTIVDPMGEVTPPLSPLKDPASLALAGEMAGRLLRLRLDRQVRVRAAETNVTRPPSPAQLSRLRRTIYHELFSGTADLQRLRPYLCGIGKRDTARRQFESGRVGDKTLLEWLRATLGDNADVQWRALLGPDLPSVAGVKPQTDALRSEYLLRFIDAVLARAAKDAGEGSP